MTTYYVGKDGSDSNTCTQAQSISTPKLTITAGAGCLSGGDTLIIKGGTYNEDLFNVIPGSTSWATATTVKSADGETVTIVGQAGDLEVIRIAGADKKYIILDGLIIDGINVTFSAIKIDSVSSVAAHHIRIQNCEVKNSQEANGILTVISEFNEFINLDIHDNGVVDLNMNGTYPYGIYIQGPDNLIENCRIHDNGGYGIHIYNGATGETDRTTIRNNRIYENNHPTFIDSGGGGGGLIIATGSDNILYNNLIYDNSGYGMRLSVPAEAYNNTIANNSNMAIQLAQTGGSSTARNNIFWGNLTDDVVDDSTSGGPPTVSNNTDTDPLFVNEVALDFHIQTGSVAKDAGFDLSAFFTTDFDGNTRPLGAAWDVGAYEFVPISNAARRSSANTGIKIGI